MRSWRGVIVFLLLAYGLSWPTQIALSLAVRNSALGVSSLGGTVVLVAPLLMWPPAIGAFVARRWVEHRNFADAGLHWPNWRYVLLAWFGPAVLIVLAMLISLPINPFDTTFASLRQAIAQTGQQVPIDPAILVAIQVASALTIAIPINSIFAFGEEFGWRSYLLPRLMERLGDWPGIIAHGAIWGFWHAPLIFLIGYNYPGHQVIGVPLFIVSGILMGALLAWLQLRSNSVLAPTIGHASINALAGLPLIALRNVDPAVSGVIYSPVGWVVLLVTIGLLVYTGSFARAIHQRSEMGRIASAGPVTG